MPVNAKIAKIAEAEKQSTNMVGEEAKMRKEFAADGIDQDEKRQLDAILGKIKKLKDVTATLRKEIEDNKREWESHGSEYATLQSQVGDLEDWRHAQIAEIQRAAAEIMQAMDDERWKDATESLRSLIALMLPLYAEYELQRAAKEEFDQLAGEMEDRFRTASTSDPLSENLQGLLSDFESEFASVRERAETSLDYIAGLAALKTLLVTLENIEDEIEHLANQQREFEAAWEALQPAIQETSACEFPALTPMQEEMILVQDQITAAAEIFDFATATPLVANLKDKIDAYMAEYAKSVDARTLYESRLPRIQGEVADACISEFPALSDQQSQISSISEAMEQAAADGDYETALLEMDKLVPLLDAYKIAYANAVLGQEFERLYADMESAFADVAVSTFGPLDALAQEIAGDQQTAANSGAAGDYQSAIDLLNAAKAKIDAWHVQFAAIDAAKADYERRIAATLANFDAIASCEYPQLDADAATMVEVRAGMEAAVTAGDYEAAVSSLDELDMLIERVTVTRDMLDSKRAEYETNLAGLITRFDSLMMSDFTELENERVALEAARAEMEAAATALDFPLAVDHMGKVERLLDDLDAQLGNLIDMRDQYEALYQQIKKDLAKVEGCTHAQLETKKTPISTLEAEMLAAATTTDFTTALEKAKALVPLLVEFLKLEELLKSYLSSLEAISPKIDEVRAFTYKSMETAKTEIITLYDSMTADADAAKIAEAIASMTKLQKMVNEAIALNAKLKEQEPVYIKLRDDLAGPIAEVEACEIPHEKVKAAATAVLDAHKKMIELGEADDFLKAIEEADKVKKTLLPAFQQEVLAYGSDQEAYELLSKQANDRYKTAEEKVNEYADLAEDLKTPTSLKAKMEEFADAGKFGDAKVKANELLRALDVFDAAWGELTKREAAVTAAGEAAIERFDNLPSEAEEKGGSDFTDAKGYKGEVKSALDSKDLAAAETATKNLNDSLDAVDDALKTTAEHQAEFEGRRDSLKPLVRQANESVVAEYLPTEVTKVNDTFNKMVTTGEDNDDFENAVKMAEAVDDAISDFEKKEMEINSHKVRYEERMDGLARQYTDAINVKEESLEANIATAKSLDEQARSEARKGEFEAAGKTAAKLRTEVEYILDEAEKIEDEEAKRGPAGEIVDKADEVAEKGKDLLDKIQDKAEDYVLDKALDYAGGKVKGIYHTIDSGLDAAGSAIDAADHLLDGEFEEAFDDALDSASSAVDSAAEAVQLHPAADGIKKGVELAKDVKDGVEYLLED